MRNSNRPTRLWLALAALCAAAGCGGGTSTLSPQPQGSPAATPARSAAPGVTPSPAATSPAAIASANAALSSVQTMYAALPHASISADLATLASQMVSSGSFKAAVVSDGGISATLADGNPALVFADRLGDTSDSPSVTRSEASRNRAARPFFGNFSGKPETIAVLVNARDKSGAFNPQNQATIASAIEGAGFDNSQYGVDSGDVELESFDSIGSGGVVDALDLSTHGMTVTDPKSGAEHYAWLSDTPISSAEESKYATDYAAGNIAYAVTLTSAAGMPLAYGPTYAFTPLFVGRHVHFDPGAIFINESCYGQSPDTSAQTGSTLRLEGVGRYYGWDRPIEGNYADETDAFIWDRLLGESTTTLGGLVTQRSPAQRPFSLDDIDGVLASELRSPPLPYGDSGIIYPYAQAPANVETRSTKFTANFLISDFNGESNANPPIEYFLPSISTISVTETPSSPTLTINGKFPPQPGQVSVFDPSQTEATVITPTTWSTSQIVVPISASGVGSRGLVVVTSNYGIQSNPVPLTQWSGTLSATENAAWTTMNGMSGTGSGTTTTTFKIDFRADVHPTVPSIDASPVPQNFAFAQVENDSSGLLKSVMGSFTTADGMHGATLGATPNFATLTVGSPPLMNDFYLAATPGQPATCNNGMPGPQKGPANVFCPALGFNTHEAGTCADNGAGLCSGIAWAVVGIIGAPSVPNDGQLILTMDPGTYAVGVASTSPNTPGTLFEAMPQLTGSVSGTIDPPIAPPNGMYPAFRLRRTE